MLLECQRQRLAGLDLAAHAFEQGLCCGLAQVLQQGGQGFIEWLAGTDQGGELLGEADQLGRLEHTALAAGAQQAAAWLEAEHQEAALV
ncbi:hypothetical protein D3C80_2021550 [compost metagenome]